MSVADEGLDRSHVANPHPEADKARIHAQVAASHIHFLTTEDLLPPKMPTREEMETILLGLRKQALVEEYFGADGAS
jgi:pre-mRNA-splicing factor ISY1